MAVPCAACQAENRDGAKFCKGCGHRLAAAPAGTSSGTDDGWPVTERMPLPAAPVRAPVAAADEVTVVMGATRSRVPAAPLQPAPGPRPQPAARVPKPVPPATARSVARSSPAVTIGAWGLLIAIVIVAGGWYAYGKRSVATPTVAQTCGSISPRSRVATAACSAGCSRGRRGGAGRRIRPGDAFCAARRADRAAAPSPQSRAGQACGCRHCVQAAQACTGACPGGCAAAGCRRPGRTVAAAPQPEPAAPASPEAACAGQGFFGRSRCLVAQCGKAEYRTHGQCDAVRRQQQIEEEKRNPTLLN